MLYRASSVVEVFIANSFLGLGIGLMESPIITQDHNFHSKRISFVFIDFYGHNCSISRYIGEICEPSVRGVMIAYSALSGTFGMFIVFTLNTLLPWRTVALVCMCVPILTIIALLFVCIAVIFLCIFESIQRFLSSFFVHLDSRDTDVVVIKESNG